MHESESETMGGESTLTRRDLVARAGIFGAGIVFAGALAGCGSGGGGATTARTSTTARRGGHLVWALEQDPGHIAPFGGILTSNHWGNEFMYDSLLEWDRDLNVRPALAERYEVVDDRTIDFVLRQGVRFSNGKELTAADAKYSFDLQANPPAPGSVAVLGQFPAIASTEVLADDTLRMHLEQPDARVFGYLAWGRYSAIVPEGMYDRVNPARDGIGTGPFKLASPYVQNVGVEYERNPNFWKAGLPYLDALSLRVITDEQARIAALRGGKVHGATLSQDAASSLDGVSGLKVLSGLTAAFRELQFTIKPGEDKPWHDRHVRQAINFALDRQDLIDRVYAGEGEFSGHVPPGYGPWPPSAEELREKYLKHDLPRAKELMREAGYDDGFSVTLTTFSTPQDFPQLAAVIKSQLAEIGIDVQIQPQDPTAFAEANGKGTFDWDLTARGMRGDVDGYVAEFSSKAGIFDVWFGGYRHPRMTELVETGRTELDEEQRTGIYDELQDILLTELIEVPLIAVKKFQVVSEKVQGMYVAFSDFNTGLRESYLA